MLRGSSSRPHTEATWNMSCLDCTGPSTRSPSRPDPGARRVWMMTPSWIWVLQPQSPQRTAIQIRQTAQLNLSKFLTYNTASKINVCLIPLSFGILWYAPTDNKNNALSVCLVRIFIDIPIHIHQYILILFSLKAGLT